MERLCMPAGMKVDVDFLNPAINGLKQHWQQLPEPVREVLPYAGQATAGSFQLLTRHTLVPVLQLRSGWI